MGTKEKPCKIIGGISGLLGLIVLIISCIFLAKLLSCEADDDNHKESKYSSTGKEPSYGNGNGFKDKDKAPEYGSRHGPHPYPPGGFGGGDFPGFGGPGPINNKPRWRRSASPAPEYDKKYSSSSHPGGVPPGGPGPKYAYDSKGGEFTTFYACAICGIIFGLAQLLFSGLFCSYVNEKNCKKMALSWTGIHGLLIIAYIAIFISMLVKYAHWEKSWKLGFARLFKYAQYGDLGDVDCFKMNKAFTGLVGLDFIVLIILCGGAVFCSMKSNGNGGGGGGDHDEDGHGNGQRSKHYDEKVQFNRQ